MTEAKLASWLEKLKALAASPNRGEALAAKNKYDELVAKYGVPAASEVSNHETGKLWPSYVDFDYDWDLYNWGNYVAKCFSQTSSARHRMPPKSDVSQHIPRWANYLAMAMSPCGSAWCTSSGDVVFVSTMCDRHLLDSSKLLHFVVEFLNSSSQVKALGPEVSPSLVKDPSAVLLELTKRKLRSVETELGKRRKKRDFTNTIKSLA